jgi:hypothetical protein
MGLVLGWLESRLHCPDPSFLKAASELSPHYPRQMGRGVGAHPECLRVEGGARSLLLLSQTGYISTTHQSLLHSTLSIAVHFNGSNGTAYTRPSMVHNNYSIGIQVELIHTLLFDDILIDGASTYQ